MERKEAVTKSLKTFFTGRPCSKGHIAYRYTQSGSCSACVNGGRVAVVPRLATPRPDLVEIKVCAWEAFVQPTLEAINTLTLARYPDADVRARGHPTGRQAGTVMLPVRVHPDDVPAAHKIAAAYLSRRKERADVEAIRARMLGTAPTSVLS